MPTHFRKRRIEQEKIEAKNIFLENEVKINRKKTSIFLRLIKLLIWIFILSFAYFYYSYSSFLNKIIVENDLIINIEEFDNLSNLGNKIIELDNFWYKYYLRKNPPEFSLRKGVYKVEGGTKVEDLLEQLNKPLVDEENVTLLEGWNIFDYDLYFTKKGLINSGDFINFVTDIQNIKKLAERFSFLDKDLITLEGYLYPDTYRILVNNFDIETFIIRQLQNFENRVYNTILKSYDTKTINDVINLASIVEKEERNPLEKPTVAGILKKRLNAGWMIGADITVCYAHKLTSDECKLSVTKYLYDRNEYNTRQMVGLPKTPINNPTFETINATINHKDTIYWYYLHNVNTGKIYYAETNAEHERNKSLYMR